MRRVGAALVLVAVVMAGCGGESEGDTDATWAREAEEVVALLAAAYDAEDAYQTARFFSAGGTLDLTIWREGVATTPDEVVQAVQELWFFEAGFADVRAEHLFVSPDGAVVWWSAFDVNVDGGQDWAQSYAFSGGRTASQAFRGMEEPFHEFLPLEQLVVDLADRYVAAWGEKDPAALAAVYTPDVVVLDGIRSEEWRGMEELAGSLSNAAPIAPGPWPRVFVYGSGYRDEATGLVVEPDSTNQMQVIVLVQLGGDCPMLEARRWALSGDRINKEVRYTHVPSARRCLADLPDGWWADFELPPELQSNVTEIIDVGGSLVDLVNAEPSHEAFTRWMFAQYAEAGIGLPEISAVWYPPAPECTELGGLAIESDERYDGRHTVVICFTDDRLTSDTSESGWFETAAAYGLHELAHIWMVDHLTDDIRARFNDRADLSVWRGPEAIWRERGVEHAAFTIPWGITGATDARYGIYPPPECEELALRYELLTEYRPLTLCGEGGWSP